MAKRLRKTTINSMRGNVTLLKKIANDNGNVHIETVRRWLRENEPNSLLTTISTLTLISKAINVPVQNLTEDESTKRKGAECVESTVQ